MLLLVTLALVVASAVLLILGFVQDALGFIYLSMLCAGVAALALFIFARLTRRRSAALGVGPAVDGETSPYVTGPAPTGLDAEAAPVAGNSADTAVVPVPSAPAPAPAAAPAVEDDWAPTGASTDDWGDEVVFPIEDYDDLRVAEILPLLGQLEPDELQEVRDREVAGKARATILDRIDDRLNRTRTTVAANDTTEVAVVSVGSDADADDHADEVWAAPAAEATKKRGGRKKAAAPVLEAEPTTEVAAVAVDEPAPAPAKRAYTRRTPEERAAAAAKKAPAKTATAAKAADAADAPAEPAPVKKAAGAAKKATGTTKAAAKKTAGTATKAAGATKRTAKTAADS